MVDCKNPKNTQEDQLCSCKRATDSMTNLINTYNKNLAEYKSDTESHSRWLKRYNDWQNKTGDFSVWKDRFNSIPTTFHNKLNWHTCHSLANNPDANWQCGKMAQDYNLYDPWDFKAVQDYTIGGIGPCSWKGVLCARGSGQTKIFNDYNTEKPNTDPQNSSKVWLNKGAPKQPGSIPSNNIICCSQIFNDINVKAGNLDIKNINQNCSQRINERLKTESKKETQTKPSTPITSNNKSGIDTNTITIIIVIVILLLLSSSASMLFLFVRR